MEMRALHTTTVSTPVAYKFHTENLCIHSFFHKYHFYKQCQAEIRKKSRKCSATPQGCIFAIWKLFTFFIDVVVQK